MSRLALILADFHVPPRPDGAGPWPRLPALEQWLRFASFQETSAGWRGWLASTLLGEAVSGDDMGAARAAGLVRPAGHTQFWFATPVHYLAGLDTVRLHPAGLLRLDIEQQQRLADEFTRVFADTPWRLHALGFRELLLEGDDPGAHQTSEPALALTGDLAELQPRGVGSRSLRQLAAEVEMWLHEHPVNQERERRGVLTVSGLWFWGAGRARVPAMPEEPLPATAWQLYAEDACSAGIAAAAGLTLSSLPPSAPSLEAMMGNQASQSALVVLGAACPAGGNDLLQLERDWFEPLLGGLASGRWSELRLVSGAGEYALRRVHRWRRWRARKSWWEFLQR